MSHTATLTAPAPSRRVLRRMGAVFAGLMVNVVLGSGTDAVLHATGVYPPVGQSMAGALFLLALGYRIVYGVAGSWLTARLAPDRPMQHALVLGGIGVALGTAGTIAMWGAGPAWYGLAVIGVTMPCAWLGARLRGARS